MRLSLRYVRELNIQLFFLPFFFRYICAPSVLWQRRDTTRERKKWKSTVGNLALYDMKLAMISIGWFKGANYLNNNTMFFVFLTVFLYPTSATGFGHENFLTFFFDILHSEILLVSHVPYLCDTIKILKKKLLILYIYVVDQLKAKTSSVWSYTRNDVISADYLPFKHPVLWLTICIILKIGTKSINFLFFFSSFYSFFFCHLHPNKQIWNNKIRQIDIFMIIN